jgi:4-carboxymuconolactone decarboxylase
MTTELYKKGMAEMRRHFGSAADQWIKSIKEIAPEFAKVNVEFPFGELYTRDVLDDKTRELCTVAALTVQGFALPELKVHVKGALNCGATREEVVEVITQMIAYCGFPAATNGLLAAKEVIDEIGESSQSQAKSVRK